MGEKAAMQRNDDDAGEKKRNDVCAKSTLAIVGWRNMELGGETEGQ